MLNEVVLKKWRVKIAAPGFQKNDTFQENVNGQMNGDGHGWIRPEKYPDIFELVGGEYDEVRLGRWLGKLWAIWQDAVSCGHPTSENCPTVHHFQARYLIKALKLELPSDFEENEVILENYRARGTL